MFVDRVEVISETSTLCDEEVELPNDIEVEYFECAEKADNSNSVTLLCSQEEQAEEGERQRAEVDMINLNSSKDLYIRRLDGGKLFQCPYCGMKCNLCGQKYAQKRSLTTHMRTHREEKPFQCHTCDRTFANKSGLNYHVKIHTGEKPFQCDICNRRFTQKTNLNFHLRIHTGEKPYQCDTCDRKFTQKSQLDAHMRTHTGEKPFQCHICSSKFTQKSNLDYHMKIHHTGK
ncbi:hypothetical protein EB796_009857 [Bugula neritina]|uniref:C2H2-type domain-containing protein n=1 Tax=Bugula neritina TaxID=10212 RepID=A0A7J7JZP3_BUGNE|nr:hypothetical protein EB796_009857 [Bugula neritina]